MVLLNELRAAVAPAPPALNAVPMKNVEAAIQEMNSDRAGHQNSDPEEDCAYRQSAAVLKASDE